jgi:hypothetical protein
LQLQLELAALIAAFESVNTARAQSIQQVPLGLPWAAVQLRLSTTISNSSEFSFKDASDSAADEERLQPSQGHLKSERPQPFPCI